MSLILERNKIGKLSKMKIIEIKIITKETKIKTKETKIKTNFFFLIKKIFYSQNSENTNK